MRNATTKDVAEALRVEPTTVQRYARDGRIPYDVTPGGHRRFDVADVADVAEVVEFIEAEKRPFVAHREPRALTGGREAPRSATASVLRSARTMRAEGPVSAGARSAVNDSAVNESAVGSLIRHARSVLVATAR